MESNNDRYTTDISQLIENITEQLTELEVLTSMFPSELILGDPTMVIDAQGFCENQGQSPEVTVETLQSIAFELSLNSNNDETDNNDAKKTGPIQFKLSVKLPKTYPTSEARPELSIATDVMSRLELTHAKNALNDFVGTLPFSEQIILEIILWLQENLATFCDSKEESKENSLETITSETGAGEDGNLVCMWLYMHHIYSKHKRKDIQNWSRDYDLTGFSLPGKPGVVYIEGVAANVDAYFDRLKSLQWKSIKCRHREKLTKEEKRRFTEFKEMSFEPHGARNYHMDFGLFYGFLIEHDLGHMFKEIFGVEGQLKDG